MKRSFSTTILALTALLVAIPVQALLNPNHILNPYTDPGAVESRNARPAVTFPTAVYYAPPVNSPATEPTPMMIDNSRYDLALSTPAANPGGFGPAGFTGPGAEPLAPGSLIAEATPEPRVGVWPWDKTSQARPAIDPLAAQVELRAVPNPFQSMCKISCVLAQPGVVQAKIYDPSGVPVATLADGSLPAGRHTFFVDATRLPRGIYLLKFACDDCQTTKRLILD